MSEILVGDLTISNCTIRIPSLWYQISSFTIHNLILMLFVSKNGNFIFANGTSQQLSSNGFRCKQLSWEIEDAIKMDH